MTPDSSQSTENTYPGPDPHRQARLRAMADRITELTAHIDAATYRWLVLVREFDDAGGWVGDGIRSCAHWLNWRCGLAVGTARERLRVAHALKDLPKTSQAMEQGRVSYSKARALTRAATRENEDVLLNVALCGTASHLERLVRHYRKVKRSEALTEEVRRHDLRELSWYYDHDGSFVLKGRFTPEQGAIIGKALEAGMEEIFAERKDIPAEASEAEAKAPYPKPHPVVSRRADALVRIAEGWLGGSGARAGSGDRFVVNLHTDVEALHDEGSGAEVELEDGGDVPAETARRLGCDAAVIKWLEDADGEPLSVGRKTRTIPPAIRRALQRRDGGCRFPGCTATRFVDAHHIHHWADGGGTHMNNLALLCRHHHRLVHEGGFGLRRTDDGKLIFTTPEGKRIPEVPEARSRGNADALLEENTETGIHITPQTSVPHWYGESLDFDIAMWGLRSRDRPCD